MGISSGWRALRRRPATVEASGVLFATVERECTEALPFVRMQRLGDSWTEELRADRIAQVVDYLRKELRALRSYPSNYYTLGSLHVVGRLPISACAVRRADTGGASSQGASRLDLRHGWGCLVFGRRKAGNRVLAKGNNCEICCRRSKHSHRASALCCITTVPRYIPGRLCPTASHHKGKSLASEELAGTNRAVHPRNCV
jgi:hypothetical protein